MGRGTKKLSLSNIFKTFQNRNYRLFYFGQAFSVTGSWMQAIACDWLVYRISGDAFILGLSGFMSRIPVFFLAPFAGVLADRYSKRSLLIVSQTISMIQAFIMAALVYFKYENIHAIIALSFCLGIVRAFEMPARHSFIYEMLDSKEDIASAIPLNSSLVNLGRLVGPALAGFLIHRYGEALCFFVNGVTFIGIIWAFIVMKIHPVKKEPRQKVISSLKDGIHYAYNTYPIRLLISLIAVVGIFGMFYMTLMPVFVKEIFGGEAQMLGYIMSAAGAGALISVLILASRSSIKGLERIMSVAGIIFGAAMIAFSFSQSADAGYFIMFFAGMSVAVLSSSCNALLQVLSEDGKRGRVMSLFTMFFMGMMPFNSFIGGAIAKYIGVRQAFTLSGAVCLLVAVYFLSQIKKFRLYLDQALTSEPEEPLVQSGRKIAVSDA